MERGMQSVSANTIAHVCISDRWSLHCSDSLRAECIMAKCAHRSSPHYALRARPTLGVYCTCSEAGLNTAEAEPRPRIAVAS